MIHQTESQEYVSLAKWDFLIGKKNVGWRLAINNATCVTLFWEITILLQKDLLPIDPTKSYKLGFELQKIFKSKQSVCQRYFLADGFNPVVTNGMF